MSQPPAIVMLLAQADPDWHAQRIFWSVLALAVAVIVLVAIALLVRRFMLSKDEPARTPGFTLLEMRRLHAEGELSDEEYERVRAALIGQTRGDAVRPPDPREQKSSSGLITPPSPASDFETPGEATSDDGPASPSDEPGPPRPDSDKPA